ncbi:MAG: peptidylprolyl isomerase [Solirubrobacterales bacterium]|nr:peptidylprolyl isomerase [Solirubrobacterales bacterium]
MSRRLPVVTTLVACAIGLPGVALLTGCGGGIPDDAIAKVGDTTISQASYDDSLKYQQMAASQQVTNNTLFKSATPKLVEFKAPFTDCKQRILAVVPAAQKAQATDAVLQQACQAVPKAVKDSAIQQVLSAAVLGMEAKDEKVTVSDAEVGAQLDAAYTSQIGGKANLAKFEKLTGLKPDIFKTLVKQGLELQKMQTKAVNAAGPVTDADVKKYFDDNKAKLGAESREVHVVLASSEANANAAKSELDGGAAFATVAQKYSIDATTKAAGGKLTQVVKGQRDAAF